MSRLQSASHDSGCSVLGREPETVHRVDHQAACKGRGQRGLPYLAERGVLPCRVGFSSRPLLSHPVRLSPPPSGKRVHQPREEVCHKIAKTSLTDIQLAYSVGKLYGFSGLRGTREVFLGKTRSQHAVCMHSPEVDALFRFLCLRMSKVRGQRLQAKLSSMYLLLLGMQANWISYADYIHRPEMYLYL